MAQKASYYSTETFKFFKDIRKNNKSEWYAQHKGRYQEHFVAPSVRLIEALLSEAGFKALGFRGSKRESLFRLNRDIRFSANKAPFKTFNGLTLTRSGLKKDSSGMFYMHVEPGNCFLAAGVWHPHPQLLYRLRRGIDSSPQEFLKIQKALKKKKIDFSDEEKLSRLPKGFERSQVQELHDVLKNKNLVIVKDLPEKEFCSARFPKTVNLFIKDCAPFLKWCWSVVDEWRFEGGDVEFTQEYEKKFHKLTSS